MTDCIRIAMWSGPRNLSTAMMRSFGSRADSFVTDEPFYGAYLKATGDPQPMANDVVASMDCDWRSVARSMTGACPTCAPIWYQKHMAHHMVGPIAHDDLPGLRHAFLIRDPSEICLGFESRDRVNPLPLLSVAPSDRQPVLLDRRHGVRRHMPFDAQALQDQLRDLSRGSDGLAFNNRSVSIAREDALNVRLVKPQEHELAVPLLGNQLPNRSPFKTTPRPYVVLLGNEHHY